MSSLTEPVEEVIPNQSSNQNKSQQDETSTHQTTLSGIPESQNSPNAVEVLTEVPKVDNLSQNDKPKKRDHVRKACICVN